MSKNIDSRQEKYEFDIKNSSILQKLPMLIRNAGLIETLEYLVNKNEKALFSYLLACIEEKYGEKIYTHLIKSINGSCELNTMIYMRVTKEIYNISVRLAFTYEFLEQDTVKLKKILEVVLSNKKNDKDDDKDNFKKDKKELKDYIEKKKIACDEIYGESITVEADTIGNMVVGLGEVSVKEVSMKKHHLFNVPYIPASAIKGVFRHYCYEQCSSDDTKKRYEQWFGTEDKQGSLIFLDAYPEDYKIKKDIMTPHYQKYYSDENGSKQPTDDDNPIPVKFDVIYNTKFRFVIYIKENDIEQMEKEQVEKEFIECLQEKSFGAKSSIGYGYLEVKE